MICEDGSPEAHDRGGYGSTLGCKGRIMKLTKSQKDNQEPYSSEVISASYTNMKRTIMDRDIWIKWQGITFRRIVVLLISINHNTAKSTHCVCLKLMYGNKVIEISTKDFFFTNINSTHWLHLTHSLNIPSTQPEQRYTDTEDKKFTFYCFFFNI